MSANGTAPAGPKDFAFTAENLERAKHIIAKYPPGRQASAVMPLLDLAQRAQRGVRALRNPQSLGARLVVIMTAVGLAGAIGIALLLAIVITPSFSELERSSFDAHIDRTRAALTEFAAKVESAVKDYGDWNDSYAYMAAPNAAFERESFSPLVVMLPTRCALLAARAASRVFA